RADGECVERFDNLRRELARDALVNRGRIKKTVGDHDRSFFERRLNRFADELTATRFEKQHLRLRCHGKTLRSKLEEIANFLADGGAAGLARDEHGYAPALEARSQPLDLRGFPAAFRS